MTAPADGCRILVGDDDPPLQKMIVTALRRSPHGHVEGANNGAEAIERLRDRRPWSVLVLDVMMPIANALDVLEFMRPQERWTPTIIVTPAHDRQLATFNLEGVYTVVRKSFDLDALRKIVRACIASAHGS